VGIKLLQLGGECLPGCVDLYQGFAVQSVRLISSAEPNNQEVTALVLYWFFQLEIHKQGKPDTRGSRLLIAVWMLLVVLQTPGQDRLLHTC
jgi:hypothetical protein